MAKDILFGKLLLLLSVLCSLSSGTLVSGWGNKKPPAPEAVAPHRGTVYYGWGKKPPSPSSSPKALQCVLAKTVQSVKPFVVDAGVWTAVAMTSADYLCAQAGPVGRVARTMVLYLQRAVRFPGVALTLCYLSIPIRRGFDWKGAMKSYIVFLFRSFYTKVDKPNVARVEGAVGIFAIHKILLQLGFSYS